MSTELSASTSGQNQSQPPASKRWTYFHSALQLAIQRAAHKWTYEDFAECFESYCKEEPDGAHGIYNTVSRHMEYLSTTRCDEIFADYNARENIDILHTLVTEARARRQAGEPPGKDTWRADLDPRTAVRARTIPVLREEKDALIAKISELENENLELQAQILENVQAMNSNDEEESRRLHLIGELHAKWTMLPLDDMQEWTLRVAENLSRTS